MKYERIKNTYRKLMAVESLEVFLTIVSKRSSVNISPHSNCFYVCESKSTII